MEHAPGSRIVEKRCVRGRQYTPGFMTDMMEEGSASRGAARRKSGCRSVVAPAAQHLPDGPPRTPWPQGLILQFYQFLKPSSDECAGLIPRIVVACYRDCFAPQEIRQ